MRFRVRSIALPLAGALLAVAAASAQTVYKSVGPDGKVVYSDHAPATGRLEKTMKFELQSSALPASAASYMERFRKAHPDNAFHPANAAQAPARGVTLYSAVWCGYCRRAKAWLAEHAVAYTDIDIDAPGGAEALAQAGGGTGIPVLVVDGRPLGGFSAAAYDATFQNRPR
jgi:glutaredoxin